jgi:putative OmpL-like beta-barrel porin-2
MTVARTDRAAAVIPVIAVVAICGSSTRAMAQEGTSTATTGTPSAAIATSTITAVASSESGVAVKLTPLAWVEGAYTYDFTRPPSGVINFRGFDNRHNTMTLENVVLGAEWLIGPVGGRLLLQVGSTPSTYYASEPDRPGTSTTNATGPSLWKYLQEAYVSFKAPLGKGLLLQAGLFTSPIGPEVFPIKDDWNWSRSNPFFALPFYHTGARATYELTSELSATVALYNGWNSVVDNNGSKSISASVVYKIADLITAQLLYFGGVERPTGAPEGEPWRHDFDAYAFVDATRWLSVGAHGNAGFEETAFGTASWIAGVLYARLRITDFLFLALRADRFHETIPSNERGSAAPLFWSGATWVSSGTATIDVRPYDHILLRLEYRRDAAERDIYAPGTTRRDTLTIGVASWL